MSLCNLNLYHLSLKLRKYPKVHTAHRIYGFSRFYAQNIASINLDFYAKSPLLSS